MMKLSLRFVPAVVFSLFLPLSLSVADTTVFYQCLDEEGRVSFSNNKPAGEEACLRLGAREDRQAVDDKVRKVFASNDRSMPRLGGSVVGNGEKGLRKFNAKLKAVADPVNIYFVGDSHLESGDFIRGFLDGFAPEHSVEQSDLCVHKTGNGRVKKGRGRAAGHLPKDYPSGVPRICAPLDKQEETPAAANGGGTVRGRAFSGRGAVRVLGYGISGKTFEFFSQSSLLEGDLRKQRPDLIVVLLGTNDAFGKPDPETVKRNIMSFLNMARRASPASDILFVTPPDSYFKDGSNNAYIAAVGRELRATAGEQGLRVLGPLPGNGRAGVDAEMAGEGLEPERQDPFACRRLCDSREVVFPGAAAVGKHVRAVITGSDTDNVNPARLFLIETYCILFDNERAL